MTSVARRTWRWVAGITAGTLILLAVLVGAFRIVLGHVPEYREQITAWLGGRTGLAFEVGELDARLRLYGPALTFDDVVVRSRDGLVTLATARRGSVALNLVESVRTGRLIAGRFELEGPELAILRKTDGRLRLVGQDSLGTPQQSTGVNLDALPTGTLVIRDAKLTFVDQRSPEAPIRVFDAVELELERSAQRMSATGRGTLPADLGRGLSFEARSRGRLDDPKQLSVEFSIASDGLDLAGWRRLAPAEWPLPTQGLADLEAEGEFQGSILRRLGGELRLRDVEVELPEATQPLPAPAAMEQPADHPLPASSRSTIEGVPAAPDPARFAPLEPPTSVTYALVRSRFAFERNERGSSLALDELEIVGSAGRWRPTSLELTWSGRPAERFSLAGRLSHASPAALWPLLAYAPDGAIVPRLRAADLHGEFADLEFEVERAPDSAVRYSASGRFLDLATRAFEKVPAISGLTGRFEASELGGRLELDTTESTADLPRWFLEPVRIGQIDGAVTWRRMSDGWRVISNEVRLTNPAGRARGSFELTVPLDGSSPVLDAIATIEDVAADRVTQFLPVGRLRPRSVAWLSQALIAGRGTSGDLRYHGPVKKFPFAAGEGDFDIRLEVADAEISLQPGWPSLNRASGVVTFHNEGVSGELASGRWGELVIDSGRFSIPVLKRPVVSVNAKGHGELAAALGYLQTSPLAPDLGALLPRLRADGRARLATRLAIDVRRPDRSRFDVRVGMDGATVTLTDQPLVASDLSGEVAIVDGGFAAEKLTGRLLGGPFSLVATTSPAETGVRPQSQFSAEGSVEGAAIVAAYDIPDTVVLEGGTQWRLEGVIEAGARRSPPRQRYALTSDLRGLEVGLPAPLYKAHDQEDPLDVALEYDGERTVVARASTATGRAIARIERAESGEWALERGAVRVDGRGAALPDHPGLRIEGDVEQLDLGGWLALRPPDRERRWRLSDVLRAASVHVDRLSGWGYELADVRGILRQHEDGWQVDVAGPHAQGRLLVPFDVEAGETLNVDLDLLNLPERSADVVDGRSSQPDRLPAVRARVGDLTYGKYHLGEVQLEASRTQGGLRVDSLVAQGDSYGAELEGGWTVVPGGTATQVDFTLTSTDVDRTLSEFGFTNAITGTRGFLRGNLTWSGPPNGAALERASGTLRIEVEDGQVLNVEPGAGRLLGLTSLAALPRRLALDFSDLTDQGLAFDSITGDFELQNGIAFTNNLLLRGPAAEVGIAGRTDFAAREYDQTAVVTGELGASLGVAGALAGGPAIGAALLLFSQIFKEPLKGMTRGYYRISGPWEDPVVERVIAPGTRDEAQAAQVPEPAASEPVRTE